MSAEPDDNVRIVYQRPPVDYDAIIFPSDSVTYRTIRNQNAPANTNRSRAFEELSTMHFIEQRIADVGYYKGIGDSVQTELAIFTLSTAYDEEVDGPFDQEREFNREIEELAKFYQKFGIADGIEATKQLARRIEDQAVEQAKQKVGRANVGGS